MGWKPNRAIAVLLAIIAQPFAMLYLSKVRWALFYLFAPVPIILAEYWFSAPWVNSFSITSLLGIVCAIHSYRLAARAPAVSRRSWYSRWYGMVGLVALSIGGIVSLRAFFYEPFRMPSGSMLPTIEVGSYMVIKKYGYGNYGTYGVTIAKTKQGADLNRGDLVVFDYPLDPSVSYIKRVIGVPGDKVVLKNRQLFLNGRLVNSSEDVVQAQFAYDPTGKYTLVSERLSGESYRVAYIEGRPRAPIEVVVPRNSYFVLGDNRDNSRDSRHFGFIPKGNVVGKVVYIYPGSESVQ